MVRHYIFRNARKILLNAIRNPKQFEEEGAKRKQSNKGSLDLNQISREV